MTLSARAFALLVVLSLAPFVAAGETWPEFRGLERHGPFRRHWLAATLERNRERRLEDAHS